MGSESVDQIGPGGVLVQDRDAALSPARKRQLVLDALPGAQLERHAGRVVVRFGRNLILTKQVTHLGRPWEGYKKRIQIPRSWIDVESEAHRVGLTARFVGVYHYGTTIFVDFDPTTYVLRKANNSAAHLSTLDLFQAQTLGQFSREDKNGNRITSVRADLFAIYLSEGYQEQSPHVRALDDFSDSFLDGVRLTGLAAAKEMFDAEWPDKFQNEWAGFYVEFRLHRFIVQRGLQKLLQVQKEKRKGEYDYDLRFLDNGSLVHYGDLKASNIHVSESPGNDAKNFYRCLSETGRFWYVLFEHETWHSRDHGDDATREWNEWRRSVGHVGRRGDFDPLSYASRFKEAVRFVNMKVLEVNSANVGLALGDFQQDFKQADGVTPRNLKVSIKKKDIDNFIVHRRTISP